MIRNRNAKAATPFDQFDPANPGVADGQAETAQAGKSVENGRVKKCRINAKISVVLEGTDKI